MVPHTRCREALVGEFWDDTRHLVWVGGVGLITSSCAADVVADDSGLGRGGVSAVLGLCAVCDVQEVAGADGGCSGSIVDTVTARSVVWDRKSNVEVQVVLEAAAKSRFRFLAFWAVLGF